MAHSDSKREAIEVAAQPLRELQKAEHDEIAAAQRALREAERAHDRTMVAAERDLRTATSATPVAAYGRKLILFEDRLSTPGGNHALTSAVTLRVEDAGRSRVTLTIEEPAWTEVITFPRRHEGRARELARQIEAAVRDAEGVGARRHAQAETAEVEVAGAKADRRSIDETRRLIHRLGELCEDTEDVLDMAPAISAGHDGVLVATDRRLLFVAMRRTLAFPYSNISAVAANGRWFGARLTVSTSKGKGIFSGVRPRHAAELAELVRARIEGRAAAV